MNFGANYQNYCAACQSAHRRKALELGSILNMVDGGNERLIYIGRYIFLFLF